MVNSCKKANSMVLILNKQKQYLINIFENQKMCKGSLKC